MSVHRKTRMLGFAHYCGFLNCFNGQFWVLRSSRGSVSPQSWTHPPWISATAPSSSPHPTEAWPGMIFLKQEHTSVTVSVVMITLSQKKHLARSSAPSPAAYGVGGGEWCCSEGVQKGIGWAGRATPGCEHPLRPPKASPHGGWAGTVLRCLPRGPSRTSDSPVARRCLIRRCVLGCGFFCCFLFFNSSHLLCFLQGKKKKRKRDKQPGETNGE